MITITIKSFKEFTIDELYETLQLRCEVFVVEQDCVYQDLDGKDQKALHVLGKKEGKLVAYTRIFDVNEYCEAYASIGRVVVANEERKFGYGHDIMKASIAAVKKHYATDDIKISAQTYLQRFYESHGFEYTGDSYLEDGIPHIAMLLKQIV